MHAGVLGADGGCARVAARGGAAAYAGSAGAAGVRSLSAPWAPGGALAFAPSAPGDGECAWLGAPLAAAWAAAAGGGLALAAAGALSLPVVWSVAVGAGYLYLLLTARGAEPVGAIAFGAGGAIALAAFAAAGYAPIVAPALAGFARAPATLFLFYFAPLVAGAHLNFAEAFVPDFEFDASSLGRLGAAGAALVAGIVALIGGCALALCRATLRAPGGAGRARAAHLARAYGLGGAALAAATAALAARGAALHVHHALLALAALPLTGVAAGRAGLAAQGALVGVLLNGVAFWSLAGPWDVAPPPAFTGTPPACAPNVTAGANGTAPSPSGGVTVEWPCAAPPAAAWGLRANGAVAFLGQGPPAQLGDVPAGASVELSLFFAWPDGSVSSDGPGAGFAT